MVSLLCAAACCCFDCPAVAVVRAGLVDEDGTQRSPGLSLNSIVAVPALNIPASNVTVVVAGGNGTVSPNVMLQVHSISSVCLLCGGLLCVLLHLQCLQILWCLTQQRVLACTHQHAGVAVC